MVAVLRILLVVSAFFVQFIVHFPSSGLPNSTLPDSFVYTFFSYHQFVCLADNLNQIHSSLEDWASLWSDWNVMTLVVKLLIVPYTCRGQDNDFRFHLWPTCPFWFTSTISRAHTHKHFFHTHTHTHTLTHTHTRTHLPILSWSHTAHTHTHTHTRQVVWGLPV